MTTLQIPHDTENDNGKGGKPSWLKGKIVFIGIVLPSVLALIGLAVFIFATQIVPIFKGAKPGAAMENQKSWAIQDSDEKQVKDAFNRWRQALSDRDISELSDSYSRNFRGKDNISKDAILNKYGRVFRAARSVTTQHFGIEIHFEGNRAILTCQQFIWADAYHDHGYLQLTFVHEDGSWKCVSERWEPMKR